MEHIINAIKEIELKLIHATNIDASIEFQIKNKLAEAQHDLRYVERLIKNNKIEGII